MKGLSVFLAGLLFGAGVTISGMVDPMKVLNFFDVPGTWDPSLAFVMGVALLLTMIGYRFALAREKPLFDAQFHLPQSEVIDTRLVGGAALFGLGWGLAGFCPGPAVASLVFGYAESFVVVASMIAGILIARWLLLRTAP